MATGRTSARSDKRSDALPSLPPGVIPAPRSDSDSQPPAAGSRRRTAILIAVPAVLAVGAGAVVLAQHGASAPPAPVVQRSAADMGFLQIVRRQPGFAAVPDASLIALGHSLCGQLRSGVSPDQVTVPPDAGQLAVEDVSTAVGAAAGAYCPDQMARVAETG